VFNYSLSTNLAEAADDDDDDDDDDDGGFFSFILIHIFIRADFI
jgi:hypothetical protein